MAAAYGTPPPYKLRSRMGRESDPQAAVLPVHTQDAEPSVASLVGTRGPSYRISARDPLRSVKEDEDGPHGVVDAVADHMHIPKGVRGDMGNILLLVTLYFIQGLPLGFVYGGLPVLLADRMGMREQATLTLATIPYSIKLLWSPVVDTLHLPSIGLRKSWIVPTQLLIGTAFLAIGLRGDELLAWSDTSLGVIFFVVILLAATQDIAVDGWALSLLSPPNRPYASTCQSIGLEIGTLLSSSVFLALNSADFCNKYLRSASAASPEATVSVGTLLVGCGALFIATTMWLLFFKHEGECDDHHGGDVLSVYRQMLDVVRLPAVRRLAVILLISKIGLVAGESVSGFKLLEKGFKKGDLAIRSLIEFPMHLALGVLVARWTLGREPLKMWLSMLVLRTLVAFGMLFVVDAFPSNGEMTSAYFGSLLGVSLVASFTMTVMFVTQGAVFARVSDPSIGGTYITLLNTLTNFGSSWARYPVMVLVDYFSVATCQPSDPASELSYRDDCAEPAGRHLCKAAGGVCVYASDGYHVMSWVCLFVGLGVSVVVARLVRSINVSKESDWRVSKRAT